ncbi:LacI family DNA-binding transcriptional regulator [Limosilactobacillus sp.]|uniref:LacI family DNA-binding transcriptional regulator n=1 Tax=Limosilactobacillus sp. TaxID=2773925 RepID=UPI00345E9AB6
MMATLADIAKLAGVSVATASRVINNRGYLSEQTKAKVHSAMKELNYQPNNLARSLHGKQTHLVGVIVPNIANPFFAELVSKIERALFANGDKMILCNANYDLAKERNYLRMLIANQVDGIISGGHNLGIEEYQQSGLPIVTFDRHLADNVPIVSCDNYQGMQLATQQLIKDGCKDIHFLGNLHQKGNPTDQRLEAYQDTMKQAQMETHVHSVAFSDSAGLKKALIEDILQDEKADGFVCTDDLTAILLLNKARQLGIRVPEDLKVVGFDGTELIQTYQPELTTVVQPIDDIAQLLVHLLQKKVVDPNHQFSKLHYQLPVSLIRRETA